jgi:hypothetical protein
MADDPLADAVATANALGLDKLAELFTEIRTAPFFTPVMSLVDAAVQAGQQMTQAVEDGSLVHPE